jgi:hypothetical protein
VDGLAAGEALSTGVEALGATEVEGAAEFDALGATEAGTEADGDSTTTSGVGNGVTMPPRPNKRP